MNHHDDTALQRQARQRVHRKMGFYIHATVFVLVNLGVAALGWASSKDWHLWPLAGWGLGLAIHGFVTFASLSSDGVRQRMIERETEALRQRQAR